MTYKIDDIVNKKRMEAFEFRTTLNRYNLIHEFIDQACSNYDGLELECVEIYPKDLSVEVTFKIIHKKKYLMIPLGYAWDSVPAAMKYAKDALLTIGVVENENG